VATRRGGDEEGWRRGGVARPERTDDQRAEWITRLREQYQRPTEQWPQPAVVAGVSWQELGLLPPVEHPESNPHTPEKQQLGQTLFFDPRLSGSQQLACASCHDPDLAWGDGRTVSFGHDREQLKRNSPSIQNAAHWSRLFWDGRAASLEDQAIQVLLNPSEMRSHEAELVERLSAQPEYMEMFEVAFGSQGISLRRIAEAIACFERTIVGGRSRFDRFVAGKHESLTDAELIGLDLFRREAGCMNCHHGPLFSDNRLHNVGLSYYQRKFEDLGAYAQTGVPQDVGRFRTPSLRNVSRTGPLMHNGLFELPGVLNMYNAGMPFLRPSPAQMDDLNFPIASHLLKPLGLNRQDLDDLQAFLHALEEPKQRLWPPPLPGQSLSGAPSAAGEVGVRESVD
jgi:cytochrome c peroxidase